MNVSKVAWYRECFSSGGTAIPSSVFDLFEDGLRGMIHSAGINSLDFGFATLLVALETIGFGKRGIASLTSKASTVFGQVLD